MGLRPAEMEIVKIICHKDYERSILCALHELGCVEFIDVERKGTTRATTREESEILSSLGIVSRIIDYLGLERYEPAIERIEIDDRKLENILRFTKELLNEVSPIVDKLREEEEKLIREKNEWETMKKIAEQLAPLRVRLEHLGAGKYFFTVAGVVKTARVRRLEWNIREATDGAYVFFEHPIGKEESVVIIGSLLEYSDVIRRVLFAFDFDEFKIPVNIQGSAEQIVEEANKRILEIEGDLEKINEERAKIAEKYRVKLLALEEILKLERDRIEIRQKFRETADTVEMWGWVPRKYRKTVEEAVERASDGTAYIKFEEPDFPPEEFPTYLENPNVVKPCERLVKAYGVPRYEEIDPSRIIAITFPIIFGIMFADVGHGAILTLLGLAGILMKPIPKPKGIVDEIMEYIRKGGVLLLTCGISSVIWGFIFGTFFGIPGFFKPIWFSPEAEMTEFGVGGRFLLLELAIVIGVLHISSGILIAVIQKLRHGEYGEALLGRFPLLIIYWSASILVFSRGIGLNFMLWFQPISGEFDIALIPFLKFAVPNAMYLSIFGIIVPLLLVLTYYGRHGMEGVSEAIDFLLSLLSHTVSYARIFALNLIHGVLSQICATMIPGFWIYVHTYIPVHGHYGIQVSIVGIIAGTLIILMLEALIAFLHTLRLHWVEWFSKFYIGEGKEFLPFKSERLFTIPTYISALPIRR
ncbi:MAG: V-type ATP synthase subunit I [Candidatus Baldrarchaeia archaeon]